MIHITFEIFGIIFIILLYCSVGIWFSEWNKNNKQWKTLYELILRRKMKKLIKKYPNNYKYDKENDRYWYDSKDVSKRGSNALENHEVTQYMDDWSMFMYLFWPIFGIIEFIRKKIYENSSCTR